MLVIFYIVALVYFMLLILSQSTQTEYPQLQTRQSIPIDLCFSPLSKLTSIFLVCSGDYLLSKTPQHNVLSDSIQSFMYYNTYPLFQLIVVDQCSDGQRATTDYLYDSLPKITTIISNSEASKRQNIKIVEMRTGFVSMLHKVFAMVQTKYVDFMPATWVTLQGFGIVDQQVDVLDYANEHNIKIIQATQMYSLWGEYRFLGKMMKTTKGTKFHEIGTFKPAHRYFITFNPSVLNFQHLYNSVMAHNVLDYSRNINCGEDRDCLEQGLSSDLFKRGYFQAFVNDGIDRSNVVKQT